MENDCLAATGTSPMAAPAADLKVLPEDGFKPPATELEGDSLAKTEAVAIGNGEDIEALALRREYDRHQNFQDWLNRGVTVIMVTILVCLFLAVISFAWHILTPASLHYLSESQLDTIKTILGTAVFSSALTGYVNKRMR
jgi:hypothetical protein